MSPATTDAIRIATYTVGDQQRALYALRGIVNDYLDQAAKHDVPPADIAALYPLENEALA